MNRSYYENFQYLNTYMKFFMVVVFCMAADMCEVIYETNPYPARQECQLEAAKVREYMMDTYPTSAGEIYCLHEEELKMWEEWMRKGGMPTIPSPIDA